MMNLKILSGVVLGASLLAAPAAAVTIVGSAAVSMIGISADAPSIGLGTTFTNTNFSIVGSAVGDFVPALNQTLVVSSLTVTNGQAFSFTSGFGDFVGTVTSSFAQGPVNNRVVSAFVLGTFTPAGALSSFDVGPASATFSFTQTNLDGAVSGSFTLASPPAIIPEPATWAMMIIGFGLVGLGARRRRTTVMAA